MLVLPFTSDPARSFTTQLGDEKHTIEARYNDRSESWTFDIVRDADQVTLVTGVPLLLGGDMLAPYSLLIGGLVAADLGGTDTDAGPDDLGDRVIVVWLSNDELIALGLVGVQGLSTTGGDAGGGSGGDTGGSPAVGIPLVPLVDIQQHGDDSGNEVLTSQFTADLTPMTGTTITLNIAFLAASQGGTATYRAYIGGTTGVIDGTPVGTATRTGSAFFAIRINGTIPNPGGMVPVKITMQSSGVGIDALQDDLTGVLG
jgi:hypothetical protein